MYYSLLANINGKWKEILPHSNNVGWSQDSDNLGIELNFDSMISLNEGCYISLRIDGKEHFRGIVIKRTTRLNTYSYTCLDFMFYLNKNSEIIQFNGLSASECIKQLLRIVTIKHSIPNIQTRIKKIYKQQSISLIIDDILQQVLDETGVKYIYYMQADTYILERLTTKRLNAKLQIDKAMTRETAIDELVNSVIVIASEGENTNILAKKIDAKSISKYGRLQEVIGVDKKEYSKAQQIALNTLALKNKPKNTLTLNCINIENGENIRANTGLHFNLQAKFGGNSWYWVKTVSHNLSNNKHYINLTLQW